MISWGGGKKTVWSKTVYFATGSVLSLPILPSLELTALLLRSGLRAKSMIITDFPEWFKGWRQTMG